MLNSATPDFLCKSSLFVWEIESSLRPGTPRVNTTTSRWYLPRAGRSGFCRVLSTSAGWSPPSPGATRSFLLDLTAPAPEVVRSLSRCFSAPRPVVQSRGPGVAGGSGDFLACVWAGGLLFFACTREVYIVLNEQSISYHGLSIPVTYSLMFI